MKKIKNGTSLLGIFSKTPTAGFETIQEIQSFTDANAAVDRIEEIYRHNTVRIQEAFDRLSQEEKLDQQSLTSLAQATYPFVGIRIETKDLNNDPSFSYGLALEAGTYGTTVTRPDIFKDYYREQIGLLIERHKVPIIVGVSDEPIPMPFVIEHTPSELNPEQLWQVQNYFVLPNLSRLDDDIPNCIASRTHHNFRPLSLFSGERIDFSLQRLHHYTATAPEHFQSFILLTNYQRYVEAFIEFGKSQISQDSEYTELVLPGNVIIQRGHGMPIEQVLKHMPQMPAYHLKRKDGQGITFINIGVGPSNAKTITDHLAVLRPHCWLMLGHCAGLRSTQVLGDYILAHAYVREDNVLDQDLPRWVPLPAIAEVQVALQTAVANVLHNSGPMLKTQMRTGTIMTTDNRNWELRTKELYERFRQSRAIAVDMESATVAANGFRFRVPYGTLLCISDKPIHGEIKLRGMANNFYQQRVKQHLEIGLEAIHLLREKGVDQLHSRKLRGFDEPPFR